MFILPRAESLVVSWVLGWASWVGFVLLVAAVRRLSKYLCQSFFLRTPGRRSLAYFPVWQYISLDLQILGCIFPSPAESCFVVDLVDTKGSDMAGLSTAPVPSLGTPA